MSPNPDLDQDLGMKIPFGRYKYRPQGIKSKIEGDSLLTVELIITREMLQ